MNDGQKSIWSSTVYSFLVGSIIIGVAMLILIALGYAYEWRWTGFTTPKPRTLWDWLDLLIVPLVLTLGGYLFTSSENRRTRELASNQRVADQKIADQRAKTDREIADQSRQDDMLQAYLNHMGELLLDKDRPLRKSKEGDEARTLARARTLAVVERLTSKRKGNLLLFLYEATLINRGLDGEEQAVICLSEADLSQADLSEGNLSGANLSEANLREANLREVNLHGTNLCAANLSNTDLSEANLGFADLTKANLSSAKLREADLYGAKMNSADLTGADLTEADLSTVKLSGANLRGANLTDVKGVTKEKLKQQAASLEGTIMPNT